MPIDGTPPMDNADDCPKRLLAAMGELDGAKKKLAEYDMEQKGLLNDKQKMMKENEALKVELVTAKEGLTVVYKEKKAQEIAVTIDKFIAEKKVVPAQKEVLFQLLMNVEDSGVRKFKVGVKEYDSYAALVKLFIEVGNGLGLPTDERSENGVPSLTLENREGLAKAALEFAAKNKVSYKEALITIAGELEQKVKAKAQ